MTCIHPLRPIFVRFPVAPAAVVAGLVAACASTGPPRGETVGATDTAAWTVTDDAGLSPTEHRQRSRAVAARDAMFGELLGTLQVQLAEVGPAGAIGVCRDVAPRIARRTGEAHGVRIGRTSWKLRNPANVGPPWVQRLVEDRPAGEVVARADDGRLGVLLPIRVMPACISCHGPRDAIPDDVRGQIARHYPDDEATGFARGDLRGWFWIEVPPGDQAGG